jgi:hypothetical protein
VPAQNFWASSKPDVRLNGRGTDELRRLMRAQNEEQRRVLALVK